MPYFRGVSYTPWSWFVSKLLHFGTLYYLKTKWWMVSFRDTLTIGPTRMDFRWEFLKYFWFKRSLLIYISVYIIYAPYTDDGRIIGSLQVSPHSLFSTSIQIGMTRKLGDVDGLYCLKSMFKNKYILFSQRITYNLHCLRVNDASLLEVLIGNKSRRVSRHIFLCRIGLTHGTRRK